MVKSKTDAAGGVVKRLFKRRQVLDVAEVQFERFGRIWARLYGAPGSKQAAYTRSGLMVSAGVGLAAVVLFVGRAERLKRQRVVLESEVESGSD